MEISELIELARDCGFKVASALDPATLQFLPEVREMCAADKCHNYNKSWSCPPAAGELDALAEKCAMFHKGVIVQTVGVMEDEFDIETMTETGEKHKAAFERLTDRLTELGLDCFPMGMGTCTRCKKCTYPDAPCRFPDKVFPSMEACGLLVSQVCTDNGIKYYYGPNTLAYTSCVLYR